MKIILERLNRRLQEGTHSDVTIAAISCLALCEIQAGNHRKWEMHIKGMAEMIRVKGGFASIPAPMHMKIYRADMIGAVDTLSIPHLPRPIRLTRSLYHTMGISSSPDRIVPILIDLGLTPVVFDALIDLSYLCQALNQAAEEQVMVDPIAFDEDTVCIQYDLLSSNYPKQRNVEKACRLGALIFLQSLTRETISTKLCSSLISRELRYALLATDAEMTSTALMFWILFMGSLMSTETDDKDWYQARLRGFLQMHHYVGSWENAKILLKQAFWVDAVQEEFGMNLWREIDAASAPGGCEN